MNQIPVFAKAVDEAKATLAEQAQAEQVRAQAAASRR